MTTGIEWTEETWNPTVGCSRVSPGCDGCYAINVAHRAMQPAHEGLTIKRPGERTDWTGVVRCLPDRLDVPVRRRKPTTFFVDSMSDLFHPDVPDAFIARVWATLSVTPRHTYQVLTKRPQRMAAFMRDAVERWGDGNLTVLPHVWLGTSIESDRFAFRADHLRATPAAVRFLSLEPLLGPLPSLELTETCPDCRGTGSVPVPGGGKACTTCWRGENDKGWFGEPTGTVPRFDWVIVGGESGPGARPMHPKWVRDIRDRCQAAGIPFFFKQWGAWLSVETARQYLGEDDPRVGDGQRRRGGKRPLAVVDDTVFIRVGKKDAGRELDGRVHDDMPPRGVLQGANQ